MPRSPTARTSSRRAASRPRAEIRDADLVFAGYGIQAPEFGWDDFSGRRPARQGARVAERRSRLGSGLRSAVRAGSTTAAGRTSSRAWRGGRGRRDHRAHAEVGGLPVADGAHVVDRRELAPRGSAAAAASRSRRGSPTRLRAPRGRARRPRSRPPRRRSGSRATSRRLSCSASRRRSCSTTTCGAMRPRTSPRGSPDAIRSSPTRSSYSAHHDHFGIKTRPTGSEICTTARSTTRRVWADARDRARVHCFAGAASALDPLSPSRRRSRACSAPSTSSSIRPCLRQDDREP